MNALSLVLISLSCVPCITRDPSNISPCVCFFFTDQSQLIIRIAVNTLAKAKEHRKFCPLEKEGDTGFLGQCLHSCTKLQEILAIGNTWVLTRFWLQQINSISRLYIIHLTPFLTQVLKFPEQNSSERDLHSLWANSPCHQEHCYLLWKTDGYMQTSSSTHNSDIPWLWSPAPSWHHPWLLMVGRLPSQAWGRMPTRAQNCSCSTASPMPFLFTAGCSELVLASDMETSDMHMTDRRATIS